MDGLVDEFEAKTAQARLGGGPKAQEKMKSRGKLLPRERYALSNLPFYGIHYSGYVDLLFY